MTSDTLLQEILRLTPEERIKLLGEVWDSIAADPEAVPIPEWHRDELDRRLADSEPTHHTWSEVEKASQDSE